jgi:hypothetical protein
MIVGTENVRAENIKRRTFRKRNLHPSQEGNKRMPVPPEGRRSSEPE